MENFQGCLIERDALCVSKGDQPGRDVSQILDIRSLCAFEARDF